MEQTPVFDSVEHDLGVSFDEIVASVVADDAAEVSDGAEVEAASGGQPEPVAAPGS